MTERHADDRNILLCWRAILGENQWKRRHQNDTPFTWRKPGFLFDNDSRKFTQMIPLKMLKGYSVLISQWFDFHFSRRYNSPLFRHAPQRQRTEPIAVRSDFLALYKYCIIIIIIIIIIYRSSITIIVVWSSSSSSSSQAYWLLKQQAPRTAGITAVITVSGGGACCVEPKRTILLSVITAKIPRGDHGLNEQWSSPRWFFGPTDLVSATSLRLRCNVIDHHKQKCRTLEILTCV